MSANNFRKVQKTWGFGELLKVYKVPDRNLVYRLGILAEAVNSYYTRDIKRNRGIPMILLRADHQLKDTFEKLITTMKIPVAWNGIFVVIDNYIILQGEVRSLFFHFDTKKVATNIIDVPILEDEVIDIAGNIRVQNAINMVLYAFGKWGTIKGIRVDKNREQLNQLFAGIMREYGATPEYTTEYMRFYRGGIRITYEDLIQMAVEFQDDMIETEEKGGSSGLWRKIMWKRKQVAFEKIETTVDERKRGRIGNNFYLVGYLCPSCGEKLHMVVYPRGREFRIETEEGGVILARAATCAECHSFYTPRPKRLFVEGDMYVMPFGDDEDAYEDYLELLGRNGDRVSNYRCNEYADGREQPDVENDAVSNEPLEELCNYLPELSDMELRKIEARIEEGFYPEESIRKYEGRVREQSKSRRDAHSQKSGIGQRQGKDEKSSRQGRGLLGNRDDDKFRSNAGENNLQGSVPENSKSSRTARTGDGAAESGQQGSAQGNGQQGSTAESSQQGSVQTNGQQGSVAESSRQGRMARTGDGAAESGQVVRAGMNQEKDIILSPQEREEARHKYDARMEVLERYSERQLKDLKNQLERERKLTPEEKQSYIRQVERKIAKEQTAKLAEKVNACEGKNYVLMKRVLDEVEQAEIPAEEKQPLLEKLREWKSNQAQREVKQLMEKMPPNMDRGQYKQFIERIRDYEDVDLTPYEEKMRERREAAEKQEIANVVKRARKISREDLMELTTKLKEGDFLPELVLPYLEKIEDKMRQLDAEAIELLCPNPMQMSFEEGIQAYEQIEAGDFLPELKTDALKMLTKRLTKLKTDECELLVQKLKEELEEAGVPENDRHHFYPARKVLLHQNTPEEVEVIDYAMASYASGKGLFEYPIFVVDVTRNRTGKEGMILTPDHLYISTLLNAYGVPISSIAGISAATGLLNRGLYLQRRNGEKAKIPYAVEIKELPALAKVLDAFVHYLQEKPDSRNLTYLAKEKHDTICCFRCGYTYRGDGACPKCGYQNNE